jgi:hypothetical protein
LNFARHMTAFFCVVLLCVKQRTCFGSIPQPRSPAKCVKGFTIQKLILNCKRPDSQSKTAEEVRSKIIDFLYIFNYECLLPHTIRPTAVREMFSSWVWDPNLAAVSTQSGRHRHGITGRKSVTTSCRHWNATRIRFSLETNNWSQRFTQIKLVFVYMKAFYAHSNFSKSIW